MAVSGSILVVDDEETFRVSTTRLLQQEGYQCDSASGVDEALAMLEAKRYDLLLSDIKMPDNPDLKLVREIQRRAVGMPVILVTGYPSAETAINAVELPVVSYLTKPVDFEQLRNRVRSSLDQSRSAQAIAGIRTRLERCIEDLKQVELTVGHPKKTLSPEVLTSTLTATMRELGGCLTDLYRLRCASAGQDETSSVCQLTGCTRGITLEQGLRDAISTIEATKTAFKSKELATLRTRLEKILEKS